MHPNPAFHGDPVLGLAQAVERGFGLLTLNGPDAPVVAQLPFERLNATTLGLHVSRANALLPLLPARGRLAVLLADRYISPHVYVSPDQVPTWNYDLIEIVGDIAVVGPQDLRAHLHRLAAHHERGDTPWTPAELSAGLLDRKMAGIVGLTLAITAVQVTDKNGQNKAAVDRAALAR